MFSMAMANFMATGGLQQCNVADPHDVPWVGKRTWKYKPRGSLSHLLSSIDTQYMYLPVMTIQFLYKRSSTSESLLLRIISRQTNPPE